MLRVCLLTPLARIAGVIMGTLLSRTGKFLQGLLQGSASYDFLRTWVWPMIGSLTLVVWGVLTSPQGPILVLIFLAAFAIILFIQQTWKQRNTPLRPTSTDTNQRQEHIALTAQGVIDFLKEIKDEPVKAFVKIVAADPYLLAATLLAEIFRLAGYKVLMNEGNTDYIFPARTVHNKFIVRYRERGTIDPLLTMRLMTLVGPGNVHTQPFPEVSTVEYFQIEIGGAP